MKPEELIELYAVDEAIQYVKRVLSITDNSLEDKLLEVLESKGLTFDEYEVLREAYKNPPVKEKVVPGVPPWMQYAGAGWRK